MTDNLNKLFVHIAQKKIFLLCENINYIFVIDYVTKE